MAIELQLDLGEEGRRFKQRLWRIYRNQLNEWGRRQVGDFDRWAESEEKAWRKGRRNGHSYDEWVERMNYIPEHVARASAERARFAEQEMREVEFFMGSTYRRMREEPGMQGVMDEWWGKAERLIRERSKTAMSVLPMMHDELQQIQEMQVVKVRQASAVAEARVKSLEDGMKKNSQRENR